MKHSTLLELYEAIVLALINLRRDSRMATVDEIVRYIYQRQIFQLEGPIELLEKKVRSCIEEEEIKPNPILKNIGSDYIKLVDTYSDYPFMVMDTLDILIENTSFYLSPMSVVLDVFDTKLNARNQVDFKVEDIICIITKKNPAASKKARVTSGQKKFIYVIERFKEKEEIGIYTVNKSLAKLLETLDPLRHNLSNLSDSKIVNVRYFTLRDGYTLIPEIKSAEIVDLGDFKFSKSKAAKKYINDFTLIQNLYRKYISLQNSLLGLSTELKAQHLS